MASDPGGPPPIPSPEPVPGTDSAPCKLIPSLIKESLVNQTVENTVDRCSEPKRPKVGNEELQSIESGVISNPICLESENDGMHIDQNTGKDADLSGSDMNVGIPAKASSGSMMQESRDAMGKASNMDSKLSSPYLRALIGISEKEIHFDKDLEENRCSLDLISENFSITRGSPSNPTTASVSFSDSFLEEVRELWRNHLIIRPMGRYIPEGKLIPKIKLLWKTFANFTHVNLGKGFFLLDFDSKEDYQKALMGGPWIVFDHYLLVQKWSPNFKVSKIKEAKTLAWARILELPVEYYRQDCLHTLTLASGLPLKLDQITAHVEKGQFARVCVEIDLNQPLITDVCVGNISYFIELVDSTCVARETYH